ncbi:MAG TPA: hypothetical protein VLL97_00860 [Acidobacteriota bacterium]|nr:hypothetical protein [Acidobacteriota bacterium]
MEAVESTGEQSPAIINVQLIFTGATMAKSRDIRKDVKKKPAKSIKEKRKARLEKKSK